MYEVNRTCTFKVIGNIKLHVKVGGLLDAVAADVDATAAGQYDPYVSTCYRRPHKNQIHSTALL
jgi:hypothetical protein